MNSQDDVEVENMIEKMKYCG